MLGTLLRIHWQWKHIISGSILCLGLTVPAFASAATYYWVGNDAASTNVASNWKTTNPASCGGGNAVSVPGSADTIVFDPDCDNGATIDATLNVLGLTIQQGYTGTITQSTGITIAIGTTGYTQSSGTFTGGNSSITLTDSVFTMTGGTFTNTSGGLSVERNINVRGGNFSNVGKTIAVIDSSNADDTTIYCSTPIGGTITINKDSGGDLKVATGCSISLGASPTTVGNGGTWTNSGTINVTSGTWTQNIVTNIVTFTNNGIIAHAGDGWDTNDTTLINAVGATISYSGSTLSIERNFSQLGTFNLTGKTITLDGGSSADDTTIACSGVLGGTVVITKNNDGDFKNSTGCTINLGVSPTTQLGGATVYSNSGTMLIGSGTWVISAKTTVFVNYGVIAHAGNGIDWDVTQGTGGFTNAAGATFSYSGSTINMEGNFSQLGTFDLSGKTLTFDDTTSVDDTILGCSSTLGGTVVITKDSGGDFKVATGCSITLGANPTSAMGSGGTYSNSGTITVTSGLWTMNGSSSTAPTFTNFGTITHNGNGWDVNDLLLSNAAASTITYAGSAITAERNFSQSGTFNLTGITITFDDSSNADDTTISCSGALGGTVVITKDSSGDFKVATGCSITLGANPTTAMGSGGTYTNSGTITVASGLWTMNGASSAAPTFTNFGTITHSGNGWDINDTNVTNSATATMSYAGSAITAERNFSQSGTFNLTGITITFDDSSNADDTTISCSGALGGTVVIAKNTTGDFINSAGCTINLGNNPTSELNQSNTLAADGTHRNDGTIIIPSGTWTIYGCRNSLLNNGTITHNGNGWIIDNVGCSAPEGGLANSVTGTITYSGSAIFIKGDFTQQGTFDLTGKTITFYDTERSNSSVVVCNGSLGATVIVAKNDGGNFTNSLGCSLTLGANPTTALSTGTFTNSGTITISSGSWTLNGSGTAVLMNKGTITHSGNGWDMNGVNLTNTAGKTITFAGTAMSVDGNFLQSGIFDISTIHLFLDGIYGSSLLCSDPIDTLTVSKTANFVSLSSNCDIDDFTIDAGVFDVHGYDLTAGTFSNNGTLALRGTEDVTLTMDDDSGTVMYYGTGSSLTLGNSYHNLTLQSGLIARWTFDESSAGSFTDASGFNAVSVGYGSGGTSNTPQPAGDAAPITGNANSINFDGVDDYVSLGTMRDFGTTIASGPITVSLWIKTTDNVFALLGSLNNGFTTALYFYIGYPTTTDIEWFTRDQAGLLAVKDVSGVTTVTNGGWHHLLAIKNGQSTNDLSVYVDGSLMPVTTVQNTASNPTTVDLEYPMILGGYNSRGTPTDFMNGKMDDVRFYRRALTTSEIEGLAAGEEYPTSDIVYTPTSPVTVAGTLTLNGVTMNDTAHPTTYGSLVRNGGVLSSFAPAASSTTGTMSGGGGGGGRRSDILNPLQDATRSELLLRLEESQKRLQNLAGAGTASGKVLTSPFRRAKNRLQQLLLQASQQHLLLEEIDGEYILFTDVPTTAWFAPYISYLIEEGIAEGYRDAQGKLRGIFGVADPVTKAEILKMALQAAARPLVQKEPQNRSAQGTWAAPYVTTAEDLHLPLVASITTDVHRPASRADVIATLLQVFDIPLSSGQDNPFSDLPSTHPQASAILTATSLGIISGDTDATGLPTGKVRPDEPINRAEVSKMVAGIMKMKRR